MAGGRTNDHDAGSPIPTLDDETNQIRSLSADAVAQEIIPNEHLPSRGAESAQLRMNIQKRVLTRFSAHSPSS